MLRPHLRDLPALAMPAGYTMRTWRPGDEQAWADIMNTGIGSDWTAEKVTQHFTSKPQFAPGAVFFAVRGDQPVGTAAAWRVPETETRRGYVHMVCVLPEHRGRNLGYLVTLATARWFQQHGFEEALLETDDWRVPAIRSYLRLGFAPVTDDDEMRQRWRKVMAEL
jgi:mycothiol synthase